ncbi:MAG: uridine kinase family protein [Candidatus Heteroscillospira sp.]|jgi:uridine kinase
MPYLLSELNRRVNTDPRGFIEECDHIYHRRLANAAERIIENMSRSPIVLLSGPSGSGKTTTAMKLEEELERRGVQTHAIAMDNYFNTISPKTMPRTPEGDYDFESPLCMDMELLNEHFAALSRGERIYVPRYEFSRHMRVVEPSQSLRLGKDEIAVFEGIHALNDDITGKNPDAFKLYISARSDVLDSDDNICFKGTWMRFVRRTVRDNLYRGTDAASTLSMWANVRRGEKLYISPFKNKADLMLDTSFAYEVPVMRTIAPQLFETVPQGAERYEELRSILPAFQRFEGLSADYLAPDALLREFIGGGVYAY